MTNGISNKYLSTGRECVSTDELGMKLAEVAALRSTDPNTQVGVCIINENGDISIGCNREPDNWKGKKFPWGRVVEMIGEENSKYPYVIHAEMNAIVGSKINLANSTLYTTLFPCRECAKLIVKAGIRKVVYLNGMSSIRSQDIRNDLCSRRLLTNCGVDFIKYEDLLKEKDEEALSNIKRLKQGG